MQRTFVQIFYAMVFALISHGQMNAMGADDAAFSHDEQQEIMEMANALRFYFDEIGQFDDQGRYQITDVAALEKLMANGDVLALRVHEIYFNGSSELGTEDAVDFAKCVAGKFADSYGSIARAFLKGEIFDLLKKKDWGKAAQLMFKVLRAAGKSASAASLAVEAGIYGWQCRGKW